MSGLKRSIILPILLIQFAMAQMPSAPRALVAATTQTLGLCSGVDAYAVGQQNLSPDMCAAINTTRQLFPSQPINACGYTGTQYCAGENATTMLGTGLTLGKLYLGYVTMVIDGPISGHYDDAQGSGVGTPAITIPSHHWGIQGLSRHATVITFCTGPAIPINKCQRAFPQRSFPITSTIVSGNVMTVNLAGVTTSTAFPGEYVMLKSLPFSQLKVQTVVNGKITVPVPTSAVGCPSNCGTAYLHTPVIGIEPVGGPYLPNGGGGTNSFGQNVDDVGTDLQQYLGAVGFQSLYGNETSGVKRLACSNNVTNCFESYSSTSQNGGKWADIVTGTGSPNSVCDYGTTGIILADMTDRGVDGFTITMTSSTCAHKPLAAVLVDKDNELIQNGHAEYVTDMFLIGSNEPTSGVEIDEMIGQPVAYIGHNIVHISNVFGKQTNTITLRNLHSIVGGVDYDVTDDVAGNNCADHFLGEYKTDASGFAMTNCSSIAGLKNAFDFYNGKITTIIKGVVQ